MAFLKMLLSALVFVTLCFPVGCLIFCFWLTCVMQRIQIAQCFCCIFKFLIIQCCVSIQTYQMYKNIITLCQTYIVHIKMHIRWIWFKFFLLGICFLFHFIFCFSDNSNILITCCFSVTVMLAIYKLLCLFWFKIIIANIISCLYWIHMLQDGENYCIILHVSADIVKLNCKDDLKFAVNESVFSFHL